MNRIHTIAFVAALATLGSGASLAAGSGETSLTGNVPDQCGIQVNTGVLDANALLGGYGGEIELEIYCNDFDGATFGVASTRGGLQLDDEASVLIDYNMAITGDALTGTLNVTASGGGSEPIPSSQALLDGSFLDVVLSLINSSGAIYAGTYSDTLTFSLAAAT